MGYFEELFWILASPDASLYHGTAKGMHISEKGSKYFHMSYFFLRQDPVNSLSSCPWQVKSFTRQEKGFLAYPEKYINYIVKVTNFSILQQASRLNFDLSGPVK